ncbi:MFS transporter, CP family, cyanate transporter [Methylobacterium phyllostachyos]|uniref:MFS transporter, CP family, cyanate transporter n=1 Tax=Methylobacterium phyllostachyos TaxID=582672 RepID=A0A1G9TBG3_9HYPH|nr:MFS transporter [Methylobacterium phyllostachyos]SDM45033.1 MFS transporter, CP family, cyanate transporter [Methylobacterium phyllostachyos]
MSVEPAGSRRILLALALMLVAFNLRPALSTVGPLLATIRDETGLGAGGAAILTTLPVLCLGIACALAAPLIRRIGADLAVLAGTTILAAGLALRGLGGLVPLFAGTALAAIGIGLDNVLLPALVKRDFAGSGGLMTGLYTMTLCLGAAAGAGASVPVEHVLGGGWPSALAIWALPALVAGLVWIPFARRPSPRSAPSAGRLLRNPLAWWVTGFMGLQSSLAYILFGWLPLLLQGRGLSPLDAGLFASLTTLVQAPGALITATLAARARDQRAWIVVIPGLTAAAFLVLAFGADSLRVPAACVLGFGIGGCFGLGLTLIVLRAADAASAAGLSAMAQGIGYAGACLGPLVFGLAHEATGGWGIPGTLFAGIAAAAILIGLAAGRDRKVSAAEPETRGPVAQPLSALQPSNPASGS